MDEAQAQEELLQQYFDGELGPEQIAEVEARLASDPSYAAQHRSLVRLREMIGFAAEDITAEVDFSALYGRIERDVAQQAGRAGLGERLAAWWKELISEHPLSVFGTAGVFAAAAAAAVIVVRNGGEEQPVAGSTAPGQVEARHEPEVESQQSARYAAPAREPMALAQNSEVVQVDFGENTGTVFEIALADGVSTPVVWINDEE